MTHPTWRGWLRNHARRETRAERAAQIAVVTRRLKELPATPATVREVYDILRSRTGLRTVQELAGYLTLHPEIVEEIEREIAGG